MNREQATITEQRIKESFPRAIRLCPLRKKRAETVKEFLIKFFEKYNNELNTVYVDNKELQTDGGRRRSLGDIYMICHYYYPGISLKEVVDTLYSLQEHFKTGFRSSRCYMIGKRVYYYSPEEPSAFYDNDWRDELGLTVRNYKSE